MVCLICVVTTLVVLALLWWFRFKIPGYYKFTTAASSFWALYNMPKDRLDQFMDSYEVYTHEYITKENGHFIPEYYFVLNHLCALGAIEKMYIPAMMDPNKGVFDNQLLWEERMAQELHLKPGMRLLELGCGRGRISAHVASLCPGVSIVGINNEISQVESGNHWAKVMGHPVKIVCHSFNDLPLPFEDNYFDGVYGVQTFGSLAAGGDYNPLFKEFRRVCKRGSRFCVLEWAGLPKMNLNDPHQLDVYKRCKLLVGAVYTPPCEQYGKQLRENGFEVTYEGLPSAQGGVQWPLVLRARKYFLAVWGIVRVLCKLHILPKHFDTLLDRFNKDGDTLIEADREGWWTSAYAVAATLKDK